MRTGRDAIPSAMWALPRQTGAVVTVLPLRRSERTCPVRPVPLGRVMMARLQTGTTDAEASVRATLREGIANYEKQLADPATTPEMKANVTEMITSAKQELAQQETAAKEVRAATDGMNATDAALVKKFDPQIRAAETAKART